jgi:hypothetical protein
MAGAPPGGPAAFRSLSHETTIVCECQPLLITDRQHHVASDLLTLNSTKHVDMKFACPAAGLDGGGTDSPGAAQVRDPFAASFGNFHPPGMLPEQRGYSGHAGGATPFANLAAAQYSPQQQQQQLLPLQQPAQQPPPLRQPAAMAAAQQHPAQPGQGLQVATSRPPAGPSRMAAAVGSNGSSGHNRAGSFSESLDILAAKLGLSGPIGPNGQPVFANMVQPQQQSRPPPQRADWTFNNIAWNVPAQQQQLQPPQSQQQQQVAGSPRG